MKLEKYEHLPGFGIKWAHKELLVNYPSITFTNSQASRRVLFKLSSKQNPLIPLFILKTFYATVQPVSLQAQFSFEVTEHLVVMREAQLASVSKNEEPRALVGVGCGVHLSKLHRHVVRGWIYWGSTPLQGLSRVELAVIKTPSITALTASPGDPGSARPTGNFRPCP